MKHIQAERIDALCDVFLLLKVPDVGGAVLPALQSEVRFTREREREIESERERWIERERETDRQRERQTEREIERQRENRQSDGWF